MNNEDNPISMCTDCASWQFNADLSGVDYTHGHDPEAAEARCEQVQRGVSREIDTLILGSPIGERYFGRCDCCEVRADVTDYRWCEIS
jgi:hypothetical protein